MSATIRDARPEDAPTLAAAERFYAQTPGFLVSHPDELQDDNFKRKIEELSQRTNGKYIVAEKDGQIIGHAMLDPMPLRAVSHVVHLTIVVHEGHRGAGVGALLLKHLIRWAKEAPEVERIELRVRATNLKAIALYERLGFKEEGRFQRRIRVGEDKYVDDISMALFPKE